MGPVHPLRVALWPLAGGRSDTVKPNRIVIASDVTSGQGDPRVFAGRGRLVGSCQFHGSTALGSLHSQLHTSKGNSGTGGGGVGMGVCVVEGGEIDASGFGFFYF